MTEYALILLSTILVNNFVLVKFLGLCPFMGVSRKLETAMGMALATTFVLTLSSMFSFLVNHYILTPLGIEYMRTIMFILVIAVVVQFTEMVVHKTSPLLYNVLGIFLPLITTNCAILGLALFQTNRGYGFVEGLVFALGAGAGVTLALVLLAAIFAAGCAGLKTPPPVTDPTVPDAWQESPRGPSAAQGPTAGELAVWWRQLGDPVLDELVERVITGNVDLETAAARVEEARARRGLAKSELGPSISANLT